MPDPEQAQKAYDTAKKAIILVVIIAVIYFATRFIEGLIGMERVPVWVVVVWSILLALLFKWFYDKKMGERASPKPTNPANVQTGGEHAGGPARRGP